MIYSPCALEVRSIFDPQILLLSIKIIGKLPMHIIGILEGSELEGPIPIKVIEASNTYHRYLHYFTIHDLAIYFS